MRDPVEQMVFKDNWPYRRGVLFATLIYIAFNISWIIVKGEETAMNTQIVLTLIGAGVAIVMAYVFGAVGDDYLKRKYLEKVQATPQKVPDMRAG